MKKKKFDKLDKLKFAFAGSITTGVFVLIVEIFLWIKFVPLYNSIMTGIYGTSGNSEIFRTFLVVLILGFLIGFLLSWIFSWVYNKLLSVRMN